MNAPATIVDPETFTGPTSSFLTTGVAAGLEEAARAATAGLGPI
jgi:hypothetical protein